MGTTSISPGPRASCRLRGKTLPDASLLVGAVLGNPVPIGFRERVAERGDSEIPAVGRCARLLPPGVGHSTSVDRIEAEFVDEAQHSVPRLRRIAGNRKRDAPRRSPRNALLEQAPGEDAVERLDHGTPDL